MTWQANSFGSPVPPVLRKVHSEIVSGLTKEYIELKITANKID